MYELLILVHVLAAMVWVGGGLFIQLTSARIRSESGPGAQGRYVTSLEWTGNRVFFPASLLVLLSGITMVIVSGAWGFSQAWIYLALGLFVVSGVAQGAVGSKVAAEMKQRETEGDTSSPEFLGLLGRFQRLAWLDVAVVLLIVGLMVFKPGA